MKPRPSRPRDRPGSLPGLSGAILSFQEVFTEENGPDALEARVILVNGETFFFDGLRIEPSTIMAGCMMLRGLTTPSGYALVVREEHVVRVDFETRTLEPEPQPRIGFVGAPPGAAPAP